MQQQSPDEETDMASMDGDLKVDASGAACMCQKVKQLARRRLSENCPYALYFRNVSIEVKGDRLTLHGRLPSFYMKQMLQTMLKDLDGVKKIDNRVDVVSSTGLSSVRD
jgi:osmotically-inducible protein OsmY